jgi:hypothetical protein
VEGSLNDFWGYLNEAVYIPLLHTIFLDLARQIRTAATIVPLIMLINMWVHFE